MDENKILETLGGIAEGVKGIQNKVDNIDNRVKALEGGESKKEPEPSKGMSAEDISKAIESHPKFIDLQKELVLVKSFNMSTSGTREKSEINKKVDFYKAVIKNDLAAYDKMKGTYTFDETVAGNSGNAGYFIPIEYANEITDFTVNYSNMNTIIPYIRQIPMSRHKKNLAEYLDGLVAYKVGAHSQITDTTSSGSNVQLTAEKFAVMCFHDNEELQDVNPAFISAIENAARQAFAYRMNYCLLMGDGTDNTTMAGITGVINNSTVNTVTMASSAYTSIDYDDLAEMISGVAIDLENGTFVFPKTLKSVIATLKDDGGYVLRPPQASSFGPDTIWGYPVVWVNGVLPKTSAITSSTKFGCFGDFKRGAIWGNRLGVELAIDTSLRFDYYQTAFRWVMRGDGYTYGKAFSVITTHS